MPKRGKWEAAADLSGKQPLHCGIPVVLILFSFSVQISSFPGSPRNNLIQLNLKECYNKLKQDLLHVFVCHPTADFSLHLNAVLKIYQACFGHALKPVVYASVDVPGVFGLPCVAAVMKVHLLETHVCTLMSYVLCVNLADLASMGCL